MEFLLGIFAGLSLPIQTSFNTELRRHLGSPYLALLVASVIAWVFLAALFAFGDNALFLSDILKNEPWWIFSGGLFGAIFLVGTFFAVIDFGKVPASGSAEKNILWKIFGILVGMSSAIQTAINGRLGVLLHHPIEAALISFSVGILLLTLVCLVIFFRNLSTTSSSKISPENFRGPWWMFAGGILCALFVLTNIFLVKRIGASLSIVSTISGMILGGLAIDALGLFHAPVKRINRTRILGIAILVIGILGIKLG